MPTLSNCSWRIVLSGANDRLKELGTIRLMTAINIIVLYARAAAALYFWSR